MKTALVIGGTGPTGPFIVNGLIDRGYTVAVLHTGQHEVDYKADVEHIHADPYFRETFEAAIGGRRWDVVIAGYGRLKLAADVLKGRTGRVIALGGATGSTAMADDPRWGPLGPPASLDEDAALLEHDVNRNKFGYLMAEAESTLFQAHHDGHYQATYIAYPILYGPRQPAPHDWCIVRRVLDGRRHFVIADGGAKLESRAYAENAAHAVLLAVDKPEVAAGRKYFVADAEVHTLRQRIEAIARHLNHRFEFVDMPYELARPCHVLWRHTRAHRIRDTHRVREELGFRDVVSAGDAMRRSVDWLVANRPTPGSETEAQLGDTFDYAREDRLIADWQRLREAMPPADYPLLPAAHMYRHPTKPNEPWQRPDHWQKGVGDGKA